MTPGNSGLDTFPKLLQQHVRDRGARPAIREKCRGIWRTITWRELADEAAALAAALRCAVQRGAHVALWATTGRASTRRCARRNGSAPSRCRCIRTRRPTRSALAAERDVTHVFAENQEQVDKLLEILPRCPTFAASSTTRTAACATTGSRSSSATPLCWSRAGSPPPSATSCGGGCARQRRRCGIPVLHIGNDRACQGRRAHPCRADRSGAGGRGAEA